MNKGVRRWLVGLVVLIAAVVILMVFSPVAADFYFGIARGKFVSCRNHATFVAIALDDYVSIHGRIPYDPNMPGDELFCILEHYGCKGAYLKCHMGAPWQRAGGWQMVNASPEAWLAIIDRLKGTVIPVIWCGRSHYLGPGKGRMRIVVAITDYIYDEMMTVTKKAAQGEPYDFPEEWHCFWPTGIIYGLSEEELQQAVARVNAILEQCGEHTVPLDIERNKNYERITEQFAEQ